MPLSDLELTERARLCVLPVAVLLASQAVSWIVSFSYIVFVPASLHGYGQAVEPFHVEPVPRSNYNRKIRVCQAISTKSPGTSRRDQLRDPRQNPGLRQ